MVRLIQALVLTLLALLLDANHFTVLCREVNIEQVRSAGPQSVLRQGGTLPRSVIVMDRECRPVVLCESTDSLLALAERLGAFGEEREFVLCALTAQNVVAMWEAAILGDDVPVPGPSGDAVLHVGLPLFR